MNFFESQDEARRKTTVLICYFIAAVVAIIFLVYAASVGLIFAMQAGEVAQRRIFELNYQTPWWQPQLFAVITGVTGLIVGLGSCFKILTLRSGGRGIAESLGGRLLHRDSASSEEAKLLNIVEEMSIASGLAVPPVYLLDNEPSINAFAAGYSTNDAVVGVSQGAVTQLNRDELQGVIAHEFSHILNGDMRLNIRLMGVLFGILVLSFIGEVLLRSSRGGNSRRNKNGGGLVLFGLALWIIGTLGVFFARLIKSAVSRQREFLADAAAVQYTRNPEGIGGALKKILTGASGSRIDNEHAEEMSHMFFSNALKNSFFDLLATHPPLTERIKRLGMVFDETTAPARHTQGISSREEERFSQFMQKDSQQRIPVNPAAVQQSIGQLDAEHIAYARAMIAKIPQEIRMHAADPFSARALVFALLIENSSAIAEVQHEYIQRHAEPLVQQELATVLPLVKNLGPLFRLPLLDLALPSLKLLSKPQYQQFREQITFLVQADQRISSFEYALACVLFRTLDVYFGLRDSRSAGSATLQHCAADVALLLSAIAGASASSANTVSQVTSKVLGELKIAAPPNTGDAVAIQEFDRALQHLIQLNHVSKNRFIEACIRMIMHDNTVRIEEAELLRAICEVLGAPMPPLLPSAI